MPPANRPWDLRDVGREELVVGQVAQRGPAVVRADRASDKSRQAQVLLGELVRHFTSDGGSAARQVKGLFGDVVLGKDQRRAAEAVGLDDISAGGEVLAMDVGDDIGAGAAEDLGAALFCLRSRRGSGGPAGSSCPSRRRRSARARQAPRAQETGRRAGRFQRGRGGEMTAAGDSGLSEVVISAPKLAESVPRVNRCAQTNPDLRCRVAALAGWRGLAELRARASVAGRHSVAVRPEALQRAGSTSSAAAKHKSTASAPAMPRCCRPRKCAGINRQSQRRWPAWSGTMARPVVASTRTGSAGSGRSLRADAQGRCDRRCRSRCTAGWR